MPVDSVITPHDTSEPQESLLASGGMCTCTVVRQRGRLVVRKQLLPEYAADERYLQALEKEFELGCVLQHPNIPRYLEWHDDYFLMDYVDGVTLNEWESLHPGYFARKDHARQLIDELLSAVAYLHQHGVLHLDLKPDNILMTRIGGHVKLIDLGYAYQDSYPFTTGGTPHYTAPDPVKTPASDIYSLGVIFDELGIARKSVTARCRRADAAERYQSIDQLSAALLKPRRWWPLAAAMLLLLLLGGWAWWAWSGKSPAVEEQALPPPSGRAGGDTAVERSVALSGAVGEVASDADTGSPVTNDAAPQPVVTTEASPQPVVATDDATATTLDTIDPHVIPKRGFRAQQMRELALFQPTPDSILASLILFVSDAQKPYQLRSIEAYQAAYDSMKIAILEYGKRKAPFWMQIHWQIYNGKPKFNPCDNYLYQQMRRIDSLFQANIDHYRLNQKHNYHIVQP